MKHFAILVNTTLAVTLILILLMTGLTDLDVQAAAQTPALQYTKGSENTCNTSRTVQVSGTAVVNVLPDRALIHLGVQSNGKSPKEVQAKNTAAIRSVIKAIQALGVEAKDISTDQYVIEPLYEDYDSLRIKGYRIHNIVSITARAVDKTSDVIAAAFQAGANQVISVEFYTSELRKYRYQAREIAMKAASEKASALAKAAGTESDCVLNISENSWSYFNGWNWWYGGNNQNLWTQNVSQNAVPSGGEPQSSSDTPVSMGQISIRAEVSATFALR